MLTAIAVLLVILWILGFVGFPVLGNFIHILVMIAIILVLIQVVRGKNPLK